MVQAASLAAGSAALVVPASGLAAGEPGAAAQTAPVLAAAELGAAVAADPRKPGSWKRHTRRQAQRAPSPSMTAS